MKAIMIVHYLSLIFFLFKYGETSRGNKLFLVPCLRIDTFSARSQHDFAESQLHIYSYNMTGIDSNGDGE